MVEVDDHGAIAHVCGLMVGLATGGEGHAARAGANRHAQGVAGRLGGRGRVAHHQTFALQDDGLGVILPPALLRAPQQERGQQHGKVKVD